MKKAKFSVMICLQDTTEMFFRDCLEALVAQTYDNWELYVLDSNPSGSYGRIVSEFFPEDARVHYRQLKKQNKLAYALNIGFHFVQTDASRQGYYASYDQVESVLQAVGMEGTKDLVPWYVLLLNQHDRLQPTALQIMAESIGQVTVPPGTGVMSRTVPLGTGVMARTEELGQELPDFIYSDHDELVGVDRMFPHFKTGLNKEWLRRCNYIGDCFAISVEALRRTGNMQEKLDYACLYDYLLRGMESDASFLHLPQLLYHKRRLAVFDKKQAKRAADNAYQEHMLVARASLQREGLVGTVERGNSITSAGASVETGSGDWKVSYDGSRALTYSAQKEYLFLHDKDVRPLTRHNVEKMYGYLQQKDVAVVGARFLKAGFAVDNCGYIYDDLGQIYPAFYDQKMYRQTYENLGALPRDVSMVDFGYCMINAKVFRKLGGFYADLSGRDLMLDFCFRARVAGYRIVVDPSILVRKRSKQVESEEVSHMRLMEKWGDLIGLGDLLYNPNMPADLDNYKL